MDEGKEKSLGGDSVDQLFAMELVGWLPSKKKHSTLGIVWFRCIYLWVKRQMRTNIADTILKVENQSVSASFVTEIMVGPWTYN